MLSCATARVRSGLLSPPLFPFALRDKVLVLALLEEVWIGLVTSVASGFDPMCAAKLVASMNKI